MIALNEENGADMHIMKIVSELSEKPEHTLIGVIMGVAFGGEIERVEEIWKNVPHQTYGYDTFEGHPKFISKDPHPHSFDKDCMDYYYEKYGTEDYQYDNIRRTLDRQGYVNAHLVKGLINKHSCAGLPYIDFALLDLDMLESMEAGYLAVRDKIVGGGYLFLHDVIPPKHIVRLHTWYEDVVKKEGWKVINEVPGSFLAILQKPTKEEYERQSSE